MPERREARQIASGARAATTQSAECDAQLFFGVLHNFGIFVLTHVQSFVAQLLYIRHGARVHARIVVELHDETPPSSLPIVSRSEIDFKEQQRGGSRWSWDPAGRRGRLCVACTCAHGCFGAGERFATVGSNFPDGAQARVCWARGASVLLGETQPPEQQEFETDWHLLVRASSQAWARWHRMGWESANEAHKSVVSVGFAKSARVGSSNCAGLWSRWARAASRV